MVVALVSIRKSSELRLSKIGVRDSKMLSRAKREIIYKELQHICTDILVSKISAQEINESMSKGISLNDIEAMHFVKLINMLGPVEKIYIDSPDVIQGRFGLRIKEMCEPRISVGAKRGKGEANTIKIISEHKADARYPVVSAASIVAKIIRDKEIKQLERKLKIKIGSGYPSDLKTLDAIQRNLKSEKLSPHIRDKWKTMERVRQSKIIQFAPSKN